MRNLRKIFESLGFFKRSPVLSIKDMAARINSGIDIVASIEKCLADHEDGKINDTTFIKAVAHHLASALPSNDDAVLLNRIIDAVIAIAEGDEDKASKKASTTEG